MFGTLLNKVRYYLRRYKHQKAWRQSNAHNRTIAISFFPTDKVKVGNHSYGDLNIISFGSENEGLEIGHYVSIASGVKFLLGGNHKYKRFSTYPFLVKFVDESIVESWSKGKIIVEDDAWIGTDAFIMPGIIIGKGSIVGACAVVTQNVPPYAIVAGNPAVVVKYRFDEQSIQQAMSIDYSKLQPEDILQNKAFYERELDFKELISYLKQREMTRDKVHT